MYLGRYSRLVLTFRDRLGVGPDPGAPLYIERCGSSVRQAAPTIWNSDQGSHFTSPQLSTACCPQVSRSPWMAEAGYLTIFSRSAYASPREPVTVWNATSISITLSPLT